MNSEHTGTAGPKDFQSNFDDLPNPSGGYISQLFGSYVSLPDPLGTALPPGDTLATQDGFGAIPTDTVTVAWQFDHGTIVSVDDSTGTFSETYTLRVIAPTPVPEPSSSLAIPSGVALLLALSKLRGAELGR